MATRPSQSPAARQACRWLSRWEKASFCRGPGRLLAKAAEPSWGHWGEGPAISWDSSGVGPCEDGWLRCTRGLCPPQTTSNACRVWGPCLGPYRAVSLKGRRGEEAVRLGLGPGPWTTSPALWSDSRAETGRGWAAPWDPQAGGDPGLAWALGSACRCGQLAGDGHGPREVLQPVSRSPLLTPTG